MESFRTPRFRLRSDSGLSSCSNDTLSSKDFRPSIFSLDFLVREELNQFKQVSENIKRIKDGFLKNYLDMEKKIECMIEQMYYTAAARRQELKTKLQEIASTEILSWNNQLKICEEAEDWLKNVKMDFPAFDEFLQETANMYARDIGFIRSPEFIFDDGSPSVQNCFENMGKELCSRITQDKHAEKIEPIFCIGSKGQNAGEFRRPWGVCSDPTGRILVADRGNNRVQVFNEHGKFLLEFGKFGTDDGEFNNPVGITVDKKYRIIVTDRNNHRVQVFTFSGGFIFMFGRWGYRPGQFQYPWDVDTNSQGDIAVSDAKNHRVQLFNKNGAFLLEFNLKKYNEQLNHSMSPFGLAFKPDDTLLVTDSHKHTIFKIDDKFLTATKIENYLKFSTPQGIACNSSGMFVVADGKNNRVQVFNDQEKLERVFGVQGSHLGEFKNPQGVCFHPSGSIIVVDFGNNRIQVF